MALFAVTTFVVFHFGLDRDRLEGELAAGVLGDAALRAILGINRLFVAEREQAGFDGTSSRRSSATPCWSAERRRRSFSISSRSVPIALPVLIFFIDSGFWDALPVLLLVVLLADIGIAVVGALYHRSREYAGARPLAAASPPAARGAGHDCRTAATGPLLTTPIDRSDSLQWPFASMMRCSVCWHRFVRLLDGRMIFGRDLRGLSIATVVTVAGARARLLLRAHRRRSGVRAEDLLRARTAGDRRPDRLHRGRRLRHRAPAHAPPATTPPVLRHDPHGNHLRRRVPATGSIWAHWPRASRSGTSRRWSAF